MAQEEGLLQAFLDEIKKVQGYLAHKKHLPSLGPPYGPGHSPIVGSYGGAVSYERGTPVQ